MRFLSNGFRRFWALAAGLSLSLAGLPGAASAHPHVWIKVRTQLQVEGGAIVGLHHIWVLDEGWRKTLLDENDKDQDGKLSAEELKAVAEESKATLALFKAFTTVRHGNTRVRATAPRELTIDSYGELLGMSFVVKLEKPVPLTGDVLLEVYDATFFSSYSFAGPEAVGFAGEAPAGCTITVGAPPSPQQANAFRMMQRQLGPDFGIAGKPDAPQSTAIKCTGIGGGAAARAVSLER